MSKIRTVKPELFRHERLFEAERNSRLPLRLIFIGLFTVVDAKGRFRWRPRQLKLDILPYDEIDFTAALSALVEYGFVERYEYGGEYYGYIPTWKKHQSINQREPDSILPDPQKGFIFKSASALQSSVKLDSTQDPLATEINPTSTVLSIRQPRMCTHMPNAATQSQNSESPVPNADENMHASLEMEMEMEMEMEVELEGELEKEKEKEGKGEWSNSKHTHSRAVPDPVIPVFEHWRHIMQHPKAMLDKQRRRIIRLALDRGYSIEDLCLAITGCSLTPHNCGHNDRGERYDGLHLILRSADQIDRFIRNAQCPPKLLNAAEQRLHSNVQAAQNWLNEQQEASNESH